MKKKFWIPVLIVLLAAVLAVGSVLPQIRRDLREESRTAIRDAVLRAAVECYAVEGTYPDSLDYLERNYGLTVNHRDFIIAYEVFASNLLPDVQVLVRGEG